MEKLLKDKTGCMYASTTSSNCDFYDYTTPVKNSCLVSPRLQKLGKRTSETYQSEFFGIQESREEHQEKDDKFQEDNTFENSREEEKKVKKRQVQFEKNFFTNTQPTFFKFDRTRRNSIKSVFEIKPSLSINYQKRSKNYANINEYTDDNVLAYVIEPHKTQINMIREKVRMQARRIY